MLHYYVTALLILTICLAIYAIRRPGIAVALVWSLYATEQLFQSQFVFFLEYGWLINVATGIMVTMAITFGERGSQKMIRVNNITVGFAVFVLLAAASCAWATNSQFSTEKMGDAIPYFLVIGFGAPLCIRRPIDLRDAIATTVVFGGLVMIGITFSSGPGLGISYQATLRQRLNTNYLAVGEYAMIVALVSFGVLMIERNTRHRIIALICSSFAMFALYRSGARGQAIAFLIGLLTLYVGTHLFLIKRNLTRSSITILISAFIALTIVLQFSDDMEFQHSRWRIDSLLESTSSSSGLEDRINMSRVLLTQYFRTPSAIIAGLGSSSSFQILGSYCHVVPIEVLCELGLAGILIYSSLLLRTNHIAWKVIKDENALRALRSSQMILTSIVCAMLILQLKQGSVIGMQSFIATSSMMAATSEMAQQSHAYRSSRRTAQTS